MGRIRNGPVEEVSEPGMMGRNLPSKQGSDVRLGWFGGKILLT